MSDGTEIDARMVVAENKEIDQERNELRDSGLTDHMTDQMTVTMTDNGQHHAKRKIKK